MVAETKQKGAALDRKETPPGAHNLRNRGKKLFEEINPIPQTDYRRVFSILSVPQRIQTLCVNLFGALQSLWCVGKLQHSSWYHHSSASLIPLPPFSSSSPKKLQPFITNSLWMDFFVQFLIHNLAFNAFRPCLGMCCFKYWNENQNSFTEQLQRHHVHEIPRFSH